MISRIGHRRRPSVLLWLNVAAKLLLVALLLFAVARPDLPQFEGNAMAARALTYPVAALVVPIGWWIVQRRRGRRVEYPHMMDILVVGPFLVDTAGNAANLYDTIDFWDDANHVVNWAILVGAFGQLLVRLPLGRLNVAALAIGFGAVTIIAWELLEYVTFIRDSPELETAYTDTLGDMLLSFSGSVAAAVLTAWLAWRKPAGRAAPLAAAPTRATSGR